MNRRNVLVTILFLTIFVSAVVVGFGRNNENSENQKKENSVVSNLVSCLAEAGMVIYGSRTCPACAALADSFGGYEKIEEIYVECTEEQERCGLEMQTNYVPEIQIKGEVYNGPRDPDSLAEVTNCK